MAIVKTDVPMTYELCTNTIQDLAKAYPFIRVKELTQTGFGRSVWAVEIGEGERHVLYSAAHHANEWITSLVLLKFAEEMAEAIQNANRIYTRVYTV